METEAHELAARSKAGPRPPAPVPIALPASARDWVAYAAAPSPLVTGAFLVAGRSRRSPSVG